MTACLVEMCLGALAHGVRQLERGNHASAEGGFAWRREQAAACQSSDASWAQNLMFQNLMANVLSDLGEYRRAIPFCAQSVQLAVDQNDGVVMAEALWRLGRCYVRSGLRDHAADAPEQ